MTRVGILATLIALTLAFTSVRPFAPKPVRVKAYYQALSRDRELTPLQRAVFSILLATRDKINKT
jgi:hypothetical protein